MTEDKQQKLELMNQAIYNAKALCDAYDLIEKYDLSDYTGAKEFVLNLLQKATEAENLKSQKLHKEIWP